MAEDVASRSAEWLPEPLRRRLADELISAENLAARYGTAFRKLPPGDHDIWQLDGSDQAVAEVLATVHALEKELGRRHPELSHFHRLDVICAATAIIRGDYRSKEQTILIPENTAASTSTDGDQRAELRLKVARRPPG